LGVIGKQVAVGEEEDDIVTFCRRVQPRLVPTLALHCGRLDVAWPRRLWLGLQRLRQDAVSAGELSGTADR
jgi:hypothetical protein